MAADIIDRLGSAPLDIKDALGIENLARFQFRHLHADHIFVASDVGKIEGDLMLLGILEFQITLTITEPHLLSESQPTKFSSAPSKKFRNPNCAIRNSSICYLA